MVERPTEDASDGFIGVGQRAVEQRAMGVDESNEEGVGQLERSDSELCVGDPTRCGRRDCRRVPKTAPCACRFWQRWSLVVKNGSGQ